MGAFQFFFVLLWLNAFSYFTFSPGQLDNIIKFSTATVPLGYMIMIVSQRLYYAGFWGKQIHKEIVRLILKTNYGLGKSLGLSEDDDESISESKLTTIIRAGKFGKVDVARLQYLGTFATSRFDILSINNGLRLILYLSILIAVFSTKILKIFLLEPNFGFFIFTSITTLFTLVVLWQSNNVLSNQIIITHRFLWGLDSSVNKGDQKKEKAMSKVGIREYIGWSIAIIGIVVSIILAFDRKQLNNKVEEIHNTAQTIIQTNYFGNLPPEIKTKIETISSSTAPGAVNMFSN
jgi:hypothetical protein